MSTEKAVADWQALYDRSERNRKRARRSWVISVVALILVLGSLVGVGFSALTLRDVPTLQHQQRQVSDRTDCRSVISAARRDVLDQLSLLLDVDRTVHDQLLGDALLGSVTGRRPTQMDIDAYNANHEDLKKDRALAAALVPALPSVDDVAEHGGSMPVLHPDRTVTEQHFAPCPTVGG